jgi:hypothetical protein
MSILDPAKGVVSSERVNLATTKCCPLVAKQHCWDTAKTKISSIKSQNEKGKTRRTENQHRCLIIPGETKEGQKILRIFEDQTVHRETTDTRSNRLGR